MIRRTYPHRPFPLDDALGPASRISRTRGADMVEAAIRGARMGFEGAPPKRRGWRAMVLAAVAALVLPISVVAGVKNDPFKMREK